MEPVDIPDFLQAEKLNQLVLLSGLDVTNKPFHHAVYHEFTNKQPTMDRIPMSFQLLGDHHNVKPLKLIKNQSKILRRDWPAKYIEIYPCIIVLFFDLNWSTPNWNEKKKEVESKVNSIRGLIHKEGTQVILVIIQNNEGVTKEENDKLSTNKASELLSICHLNTNQLFVIPNNETTLPSFVVRLEKVFHDLAPAFYSQCIKKIRSRPIPNNDAILLMRQQFKMAFLCELRQDTHTALRHYKLSYQKCYELNANDRDAYEILSMASLLNYKICQLSFQNRLNREAFTQYQKHQTTFFSREAGSYPDSETALIEFNFWKRQQCVLFAKLFETAITNNLMPSIKNNPGHYYESGAAYQRAANICIAKIVGTFKREGRLEAMEDVILIKPPVLSAYNIYYGQRPWRVVGDSRGLLDTSTESLVIYQLKSKTTPNYSLTFQLLNAASRIFDRLKAHRLQCRLKIEMADELISSKQYQQAHLILKNLLIEFYTNKSVNLIQPLLVKLLEIAYVNVDLQEYLWTISQLATNKHYTLAQINVEQHTNFYSFNLINLFRRIIPSPLDSGVLSLSEGETQATIDKWSQNFVENKPFRINLTDIVSFLEVSTQIFPLSSDQKASSSDTICVLINIKNDIKLDLHFHELVVSIEDLTKIPHESTPLSEECTLKLTKNDIILPSMSTTKYLFKFVGDKFNNCSSPTKIQVQTVSLNGVVLENNITNGSFYWDLGSVSGFTVNGTSINGTTINSAVTIRPKETPIDIDISDSKVAFYLGEKIEIKSVLENISESQGIENVKCHVTLSSHHDKQVDLKAEKMVYMVDPITGAKVAFLNLDFVNFGKQEKRPLLFDLETEKAGIFYVHINISSTNFKATKSLKSFKVTIQYPFKWHCSISSLSNEVTNSIFNHTQSLLQFDFQPNTNMNLRAITWKLNPALVPSSKLEEVSQDNGIVLERDFVSSHLIAFTADLEWGKETSLGAGHIVLQWTRPECDTIINISTIKLDDFSVVHLPLTVKSQILACSNLYVRQPIPLQYILQNNYTKALHIKMTLDISDAFMFSGHKELAITLLPGQTYDNRLTLFALTAGKLPYPKLNLSFNDSLNGDSFKELLEEALKSLPTRIFVMSTGKN